MKGTLLLFEQNKGFTEVEHLGYSDKSDEDDEGMLIRWGFDPRPIWSESQDNELSSVVAYHRAKAGSHTHKYSAMVFFEDSNYVTEIVVNNAADEFALRVMLSQNIGLTQQNIFMSQMLGTIQKSFRAWHGHEDYSICQKCDPNGYKTAQENKKKFREEQTAKKAEKGVN